VGGNPQWPFHNGDELHEPSLQLIAKEPVNFKRVIGVGGVNRTQNVDVYFVPRQ
jgi:hypothetical protein